MEGSGCCKADRKLGHVACKHPTSARCGQSDQCTSAELLGLHDMQWRFDLQVTVATSGTAL